MRRNREYQPQVARQDHPALVVDMARDEEAARRCTTDQHDHRKRR
jgi:hypothetical protein